MRMRPPAAVPVPAALALRLGLLLLCPLPLPAQGVQGAQGLSPEKQGLKAAAAAYGLPPALQERPDRLQDPGPHDVNTTLLRAKLGRHFDPRVMSVAPPQPHRKAHRHRYNFLDPGEDSALLEEDVDPTRRRSGSGRLMPAGDMPESIASLDFRGVRLQDGTWLRTRISPRLRRKLQHFLWAYTACPVSRRWRDLGPRFWPRWLKEGHCPSPEAACSIPPGMRCRPAATRHQSLLRWHCRHARPSEPAPGADTSPHRHCSWIKVEYPVVTRCACSCPLEDRYS